MLFYKKMEPVIFFFLRKRCIIMSEKNYHIYHKGIISTMVREQMVISFKNRCVASDTFPIITDMFSTCNICRLQLVSTSISISSDIFLQEVSLMIIVLRENITDIFSLTKVSLEYMEEKGQRFFVNKNNIGNTFSKENIISDTFLVGFQRQILQVANISLVIFLQNKIFQIYSRKKKQTYCM